MENILNSIDNVLTSLDDYVIQTKRFIEVLPGRPPAPQNKDRNSFDEARGSETRNHFDDEGGLQTRSSFDEERDLEGLPTQKSFDEEEIQEQRVFNSEVPFPRRVGSIDLSQCEAINPVGGGGESNCYVLERLPTKQRIVAKIIHQRRLRSNFIPREVGILHRILPKNKRITNLLAFSLDTNTEIYFEYYAGGDLEKLLRAFEQHKAPVPENFIWHVLYQLSDALMLLHHGYNLSGCDTPAPGWQPLVHSDIKPANILIRLPPPGSDQGAYPDMVLGDFGHTTMCEETEFRGSPGWQPPELPRYSTKADIWGVGAIIHALAHGHHQPPIRTISSNDSKNGTLWDRSVYNCQPENRQVKPIVSTYSSDLQDAMMAAMQMDPANRASARDLLDYVVKKFKDGVVPSDPLPDWVFAYAESFNTFETGGYADHRFFRDMEF